VLANIHVYTTTTLDRRKFCAAQLMVAVTDLFVNTFHCIPECAKSNQQRPQSLTAYDYCPGQSSTNSVHELLRVPVALSSIEGARTALVAILEEPNVL
jgi:hypothetical protein